MKARNALKEVALAGEVFSQVRTSIVMNMRFLDVAVFKLKPVISDGMITNPGADWLFRDSRKKKSVQLL